ncbi:MAG: hypothetical protein JWR38_495 [Mucilaginibacter sp.]|nr:hypothetical protein [Mucilaginibacter sp.]
MKNLDELTLLFPEMEQKRQESTLGGDLYPGNNNPGGGTIDGGQYGNGVTIVGSPITPPDPYSGPGFNTGGSGDNGGGGSGDGSSTPVTGTPLNPNMVNHLMNTFQFNAGSITATEKANFEKTLKAIDSSQAGDKMLTALDNYYKNHAAPSITHNAPDAGSEGTFRAQQNEYDFGTLLSDNTTLLSWDLKTVAHEMYHNFQYTIAPDQYVNNVNREADAFLFDALVQKQANVDFNVSAMETRIEVQNPTTQFQKDFNAAWDNFVNKGDASQSNYNLIISNFVLGSQVGSGYAFTSPISANEPQFLKDFGFPPGIPDGNNPTNPNPYQH